LSVAGVNADSIFLPDHESSLFRQLDLRTNAQAKHHEIGRYAFELPSER
jgi:hypothetical protein